MLIAPFALLVALADSPVPVAATSASAASTVPAAVPATEPGGAEPAPDIDAEPAAAQGGNTDKQPEGLHFVWREHPSLRAGKWLRIDFSARFQVDKMFPGDDPQDFDDFTLNRARVSVDGELFNRVQFSIERELRGSSEEKINAKSTKTQWRDVYVDVNIADGLQLRGGRFKIPFSLDQLTSVSSNDFVNRSLGADYLAPARDIGGTVHGRFFDRGLTYSAGFFEHDGDNSRSTKVAGGDTTFAARVTATPLRAVKAFNLDRADFGFNFASTEVSDESELPNGLRGRTVMSKYTFFEPVFVKGTRRRYGVDMDWNHGPFGARGEYLHVTDQREQQGLRGDTLNDARARAWYVSGAWVVTGDRKSRVAEPRHPLFKDGIGAVEVAARYERLWFDSQDTGEPAFANSRAEVILPSGDKVFTLGVNWYVNRWVKLQLNGIHEELEDPGRTPLADGGTTFWSTVFRAQLVL